MSAPLLRLQNKTTGEWHDLPLRPRKGLNVTTAYPVTERELPMTNFYIADLFPYLETVGVRVRIPELTIHPDHLEWITLSQNTLSVLGSWTGRDMISDFCVAERDKYGTCFMRLCSEKEPTSITIYDEDEQDVAHALVLLSQSRASPQYMSPYTAALSDHRRKSHLNHLRTILCIALLPWSSLSITVPVVENGKMVGLLAPVAWINTLAAQLCSAVKKGDECLDIPFLETLLETVFSCQDIAFASRLVQEFICPVLSVFPDRQNNQDLSPAILIRQHTFRRLMTWYTHPQYRVNERTIYTSRPSHIVNLTDHAIKVNEEDEKIYTSKKYYVMSTIQRLHCRTPTLCLWDDIPKNLHSDRTTSPKLDRILSEYGATDEDRHMLDNSYDCVQVSQLHMICI